MTLKTGNNNVASLAVGSSNVSAAYISSTQIYTSTAAPTTFAPTTTTTTTTTAAPTTTTTTTTTAAPTTTTTTTAAPTTTTTTTTAGNSFLGATSGSGTVSDPYILNNVTVSATGSVTIQWQQVATSRDNCDYGDFVTLERRNSSNALISANERRDGGAQISNPVTLNTGDKLVTYNDCAGGYYRVWFV